MVNDDIVTRLRNDCDGDCKYATTNAFVPCDKCEAADEIERLRDELERKRVHMDALLDDNIELMAKVASLKAVMNGRFESTSITQNVVQGKNWNPEQIAEIVAKAVRGD